MRPYVLTVTVNPAVDKFVGLERLFMGRDNRVETLCSCAGGKGINVSRTLKGLNVPTLATGVLGGASGKVLETLLAVQGIPADFLHVPQETRTNLSVLDTRSSRMTRILEEGPSLGRREQKAFLRKFRILLARCSYVIISGSNACGFSDHLYGRMITEAGWMNRRVILDTSGVPLLKGIRAKPFMIKPNLKEAEALAGRRLSSPSRWRTVLEDWTGRGIKSVLISLGERGAVGSDGREFWHARPARKESGNTVGCGDALVAGFVYSLLQGHEFSRALKTAVAAGTAHARCQRPGSVGLRDLWRAERDVRGTALTATSRKVRGNLRGR